MPRIVHFTMPPRARTNLKKSKPAPKPQTKKPTAGKVKQEEETKRQEEEETKRQEEEEAKRQEEEEAKRQEEEERKRREEEERKKKEEEERRKKEEEERRKKEEEERKRQEEERKRKEEKRKKQEEEERKREEEKRKKKEEEERKRQEEERKRQEEKRKKKEEEERTKRQEEERKIREAEEIQKREDDRKRREEEDRKRREEEERKRSEEEERKRKEQQRKTEPQEITPNVDRRERENAAPGETETQRAEDAQLLIETGISMRRRGIRHHDQSPRSQSIQMAYLAISSIVPELRWDGPSVFQRHIPANCCDGTDILNAGFRAFAPNLQLVDGKTPDAVAICFDNPNLATPVFVRRSNDWHAVMWNGVTTCIGPVEQWPDVGSRYVIVDTESPLLGIV